MEKEDIVKTFSSTADKIDEKKIDEVISNEKAFEEKRSKLNPKKFFMLFKQVKLGFEMLKDYKRNNYRSVSWKSIAVITTAILYFINPLDLMPDFMGVIGFTDDAIVLAFVFNSLRDELIKYCLWRGLKPEDYF
jgi:uncharacterized membrane protein YkvA (DUF1232 family)